MRPLLVVIFLVGMLVPTAVAVNIGASPGSIAFDSLVRSGYAEREIVITTNSEVNLTGHVDFGGEISTWLHLSENTTIFTFSRDSPYRMKLIIEPPADAQAGTYEGYVSFVTDSVATVEGTTGSAVRASVAIRVTAEVIGEEFVSCSVGALSLPDTEQNRPLEFSATLLNNGNVRLTPEVGLTIWDQLQRSVLLTSSVRSPIILPTTSGTVGTRVEQNLPIGQYWMEVSIPECLSTNMLTFSVVEPGAIADKGILDGIFVRPFVNVDEPVEMTAVFSNQGPRSVNAKFTGQLLKDNALIQPLETDELVVAPGTQQNFRMFYTPTEPGTYAITGRVTYNGKLSFEKTVTFEAVSEDVGGPSLIWILVPGYLVILALIVFFIILIRREQRKRKHERI